MSSNTSIYTGPWINHSRNTILGATITLTTKDGGYLQAFLVLLITTAGGAFWRITSYLIHQIRAKSGPHDALHYQQQAVLKNSDSALGAAWTFTRVSFAWRRHVRTRWWQFWRSRTVYLIAFALIIAAAFGAASIFSSQVTKAAGTEVLIDGANCGFWTFGASVVTGWELKSLNDSISAASYARQCYDTKNTDPLQCNTYNVPQLPWTTNQNASCPFESHTCLLGPTSAYQMDTGALDSHDILGIDAKPSERVTLRKVATCTPIRAQPYAVLANQTVAGGEMTDEYIQLNMGTAFPGFNWTYEYNTHSYYVNEGYDLQAINALAGQNSSWKPVQAFNRTDADVSMFFFAPNAINYVYSNSDPMFSANIEQNITQTDGTPLFYYVADQWITVTGCVDQYQVCNPSKPGLEGCTPLGPLESLIYEYLQIGLNMYQFETAGTIFLAMRESSMFYSVNGRGNSALKAQSTVFSNAQVAKLPSNQWQIEMRGWFAVSLASLQQALMERATGPANIIEYGGSIIVPQENDPYSKAVCQRQMIRNVAGYQNFSTLGVVIILVIGMALVVLGLAIDDVVGWIQGWFHRHHARLSWIEDGYWYK
ncbi:hypothetical protein BDZ45DRAFT_506545 [Acephala macrosclerotiorum]|nr:hypothetical protein BDZ45DRAFT_506545 [Acephala macrosclerotiorum]